MASTTGKTMDEDVSKGVVEDDPNDKSGRTSQESMEGQLGHRNNHPDPDVDPMLKDSDTDFPEPGALEEHTSEPGS